MMIYSSIFRTRPIQMDYRKTANEIGVASVRRISKLKAGNCFTGRAIEIQMAKKKSSRASLKNMNGSAALKLKKKRSKYYNLATLLQWVGIILCRLATYMWLRTYIRVVHNNFNTATCILIYVYSIQIYVAMIILLASNHSCIII